MKLAPEDVTMFVNGSLAKLSLYCNKLWNSYSTITKMWWFLLLSWIY